jgi:hypothetical protein
MPDDNTAELDRLRQALAALEAQQRELKLDFLPQSAELQRRLEAMAPVLQSGSGAVLSPDISSCPYAAHYSGLLPRPSRAGSRLLRQALRQHLPDRQVKVTDPQRFQD